MTPTEKQRIEEISEREKKATHGLWESVRTAGYCRVRVYEEEVLDSDDVQICCTDSSEWSGDNPDSDANFIAHSRQDIPFLLDLVKRQEDVLKTKVGLAIRHLSAIEDVCKEGNIQKMALTAIMEIKRGLGEE